VVIHTADSRSEGKLALLFPGQGSHQVGMGYDLQRSFDSVKTFFRDVDAAVDFPLMELAFEGPEDDLRKTVNAQPAIMAVSLACLLVLRELGVGDGLAAPSYTAGHSLGEYTALVAAEALSPLDAIRLVRERGRLMHEASLQRDGTMAAILGLDEETLESVCRETGAEIANINSEEQIVISGEREGVGRAMDLATARGAKRTVLLQVGGAFHSSLMAPALEGMKQAIAGISVADPKVTVVANTTGKPLTTSDGIKEELVNQVCSCVQWRRSVSYLLDSGVTQFVELGPGRVLSGLVRRMSREVDVKAAGDVATVQQLLAE
jgi:[acyl-carrier-protein] S-malonyltransferase